METKRQDIEMNIDENKKDTLKELQFFKEKEIRVMILELPTTL